MNIEISPRKVFIILLIIISFLVFTSIMAFIASHYFHLNEIIILSGTIEMFDLAGEKNVPTLYASFSLFVSSLLLLIIAIKHKSMGSDYVAWFVLMLIFLFLSLDEVASLHERFTGPARYVFNTSFYYAWVIPYSIIMIVFVAVFSRFLMKLPKKTMILFITSGTIFVAGAIGFEILGSIEHVQSGMPLGDLTWDRSILYVFFYTCEELLEMLGIALFIYALLSYIDDQFDTLTITVKK